LVVRILVLLAVLSGVLASAQDETFRIPPVKIPIVIDNQPVTIATAGTLTGSLDSFKLKLTADLADLQDHLTSLLQAQLNRSDRCGERLSVERVTLIPMAPRSLLTAYVHYERWACVKMWGKEVAKRLVGGNGVLPVTLTPSLAEEGQVKLTPEIGRIEADGSLGEVLQSPSFGDKLRDKISESILSAMRKITNLTATLPPDVARVASLRSVQFADGGSARLLLEIEGDVHISANEVRALIGQLKPQGSP